MKLHKAKRKYGCELNMTPMIDIIFQLLIFCMLVSKFSQIEVQNVELPQAEKGEVPKERPPGRLVVNILKDGRVVAAQQTQSADSFKQLLAKELEGRTPDKLTVLIRGDRNANWKDASDVMRACALKGIRQIKVAVTEREKGGSAP